MKTELPAKPNPPTSGMAIASLVCGVLGACTFITSIIGVVLGILALNQIKNSNGEKGGQGVAIAGIVVSGVTLVIFLFGALMAGIMLPAIGVAREAASEAVTLSQATRLHTDALMLAADYDDTFGSAGSWRDAINDMNAQAGIGSWMPDDMAMDLALGGVRGEDVSEPASTVLFFEVEPDSGISAGDADEMAPTPRHASGFLIIFVEGGARFVPADELDTLVWEP